MRAFLAIAAAPIIWTLAVAPRANAAQAAVVIAPIADVWNRPADDPSTLHSDSRQTQVLFGEKIQILESSGAWVRIQVPDQPAYAPDARWEGYPGWLLKTNTAALIHPVGSRQGILDVAQAFQGSPYVWGGLASQGVDCSGLVHAAFRLNGILIPRDSYDQWMKARPLKRAQLKPADLIFSAKPADPKKITHVALYVGGGVILEAPQAGVAVRKISFKEKYGADLDGVESGDTVGDHVIYFGRLWR